MNASILRQAIATADEDALLNLTVLLEEVHCSVEQVHEALRELGQEPGGSPLTAAAWHAVDAQWTARLFRDEGKLLTGEIYACQARLWLAVLDGASQPTAEDLRLASLCLWCGAHESECDCMPYD